MSSLTGTFPFPEPEQYESGLIWVGESGITALINWGSVCFGRRWVVGRAWSQRKSIEGRAYLQRAWSGWYFTPIQDTLCSRSTYDERGPTHASYDWPFRSGIIFEQVRRSLPTFPTMSLRCRWLPFNLRPLPFNSHLFPIGPDFQVG